MHLKCGRSTKRKRRKRNIRETEEEMEMRVWRRRRRRRSSEEEGLKDTSPIQSSLAGQREKNELILEKEREKTGDCE